MSEIQNKSDFKNHVNYEKICEAYNRIGHIIMRTPVHTSSTIDNLTGKNVYFKCENFQKTGSFKARGALNGVLSKVSHIENVNKYVGYITHSSGNHGTALAWACNIEKLPCTIVLPKDTPQIKIDAIKHYNSKIVFCEPNPTSRVEVCDRVSKEENLLIVKPYDDYDVMCGQGTIAYEFLEQCPQLDAILISVSGGGLISGISTYAKAIKPDIRIFAVEPVGKQLSECIRKNKRNLDDKEPAFLKTKAEGIRTEQCGALTFPIIFQNVQPDDVFTVTDEEMVEATNFVLRRMKMVVELSAGAAVAAVMSNKMKTNYPELKHIGVILCGGNIDISVSL